MSSELPRPRRSRKSIGFQPHSASAKNDSPPTAAGGSKPSRKSRSKSLGPGGLEELNSAAGAGILKASTGNGRRESIAPQVRSILKPTLPVSPLREIPAHKPQTPVAPAPEKPSVHPSSIFQAPTNHNQTTTIPVRSEEEQAQRAEILAKRAARRQSLGNRRVSFAPEATLHTWDAEYGRGDETPASSVGASTPGTAGNRRRSRSSLSGVTATPTPAAIQRPGSPTVEQAPSTPPSARSDHQNMSFNNGDDIASSSPFSSPAGEGDAFMSDGGDSTDSMDDDGDETMGDRTFMSGAGDLTMGEDTRMSLDIDTKMLDETGGHKPAFQKPVMWRFEGETDELGSSPPVASKGTPRPFSFSANRDEDQEEDEEDEDMSMDFTRAIGGVIKSVSYPTLPELKDPEPSVNEPQPRSPPPQSDDDMGEDMTMDMDFTRPLGGILSTAAAASPTPSNATDMGGNEEMTMEFTSVLGGIINEPANQSGGRLMDGSAWANEQEQLKRQLQMEQEEAEDDDDADMDMTMAVGGILSRNAQSSAPQEESESEDDDGDAAMEMTMDMTTAVGRILSAHQQKESAKPASLEAEPESASKPSDQLVDSKDESTASPTPAPRRSTRRSSVASVSTPVAERRTTRRASAQQQPLVSEEPATPKAATPKAATPKAATPKPSTPKAATPKAATPKTATPKLATPQQLTPAGRATRKTPTPLPPSPEKLITPQRPQQAAPTTPQNPDANTVVTPPQQITPSRPTTMPKTPSKSSPLIHVENAEPGFSLSAKKRLGFQRSPLGNQSPRTRRTPSGTPLKLRGTPTPQSRKTLLGSVKNSPFTTPQRTPLKSFNMVGMGSPAIAEKLSRRKSLGEDTMSVGFSPVTLPSKLIEVSKKDAEELEREEAEAKKRREEELKKLDLRSKINILGTPKKPTGRMSLAHGALMPGKRGLDFGEENSKKRRKSADGSFAMGQEDLTLTGMTFQHIMPNTEIKTPRKTPRKAATPSRPAPETPTYEPSPVPPSNNVQMVATKGEEPEEPEDISMEQDLDNISLEEFLEMIDISFLDDLSAAKRRQTDFTAARRSSAAFDVRAGRADVLIAATCTTPMLDLCQHSCKELKSFIREGRKMIKEASEDILAENPPLFREYQNAPADVRYNLKGQFKDMKTHARYRAKETWYKWRSDLYDGVINCLQNYLRDLNADMELLDKQKAILSPAIPAMKEHHENAKRRYEQLVMIKQRIEQDDPMQLEEARNQLRDARAKITQLTSDIETKQAEIDNIEEELAASKIKNAEMIASIEESERVKEQNRGWNDEEVRHWKGQYEDLERKSGWSINNALADGRLELLFKRQVRVTCDPSGRKAATAQYIPPAGAKPSEGKALPAVEQEFFIAGLNRKLKSIRNPKEVLKVVAAYWVEALAVSERIRQLRIFYYTESKLGGSGGNALDVTATVLVKELRSKMKIGFLIDADTLETRQTAVKVAYGSISEDAVRSVIGEWSGQWREGVKETVAKCIAGKRRGGKPVSVKS